MRITERTKYAKIAHIEKYFTARTIDGLKSAAEAKYGAMYDLPFATFWACQNGDFDHLGDLTNPTVLQIYWCKRFAEFQEDFAKQLQACTLPPSADETAANNGLLPVNFAEAMLVFMQSFFGLHSFKEAEQITLGELLIAKRAQYNRDKFQRNLAAIQRKKFGKK